MFRPGCLNVSSSLSWQVVVFQMKTQAKGILGVFLVVSGPLLLSEAGETYDLYVIGTQESGGTIRRGCVREPKNETQKTAAVFLSTFCFRKCWSKACLGKSRVLSHQGYCVQLLNEGWFVVGQAAAWARGARCVGVASSGGVRPSLHNGTCSG